MSTQSITLLTKEKYAEEAQELLVYNFEQYFLHKNFRLGEGIDQDEVMHNMYFKEMLCENNCQVYNYLYDAIAGKVKKCPKKKKTVSDLIKRLREEQGVTIDTINYWNEKLW